MKRIAVRDAFLSHARARLVKVPARHCECVMLVSFCAPGRQLQREIVADSYYGEWPILAFQFEAEHVDIKMNARRYVVHVKNKMIDRGHVGIF